MYLFDQVGQIQGDIALNIQNHNKTNTRVCLHYMATYSHPQQTLQSNKLCKTEHYVWQVTADIQHLHDQTNMLTLHTHTLQYLTHHNSDKKHNMPRIHSTLLQSIHHNGTLNEVLHARNA